MDWPTATVLCVVCICFVVMLMCGATVVAWM